MEVKEAIEFLDDMVGSFKCISSLNIKDINNKKNEIVILLDEGEKYRQMWEEVEKYINTFLWHETELIKKIIQIEQKYFPKEVSHNDVD